MGSRVTGNAKRGALTPQQRFGNWLACLLMRGLWGARYTDLGPFRVIRRDALSRLEMTDRGYGWTVEMQIKSAKAGLTYFEVPVSYRPRIRTSKISGTLRGSILAGITILRWIARVNPPIPGLSFRLRSPKLNGPVKRNCRICDLAWARCE